MSRYRIGCFASKTAVYPETANSKQTDWQHCLPSQRRSIDRGSQRPNRLNLRVSRSFCSPSSLQDSRPLHPFAARASNAISETPWDIKSRQMYFELHQCFVKQQK